MRSFTKWAPLKLLLDSLPLVAFTLGPNERSYPKWPHMPMATEPMGLPRPALCTLCSPINAGASTRAGGCRGSRTRRSRGAHHGTDHPSQHHRPKALSLFTRTLTWPCASPVGLGCAAGVHAGVYHSDTAGTPYSHPGPRASPDSAGRTHHRSPHQVR